jgi:hypothetical protein
MIDDDLFAAFSEPGDSGQDDDPFASLDSSEVEDDPFSSLGFDEDDDDLFSALPPEPPAIMEEPEPEPEWETVEAEEPPTITDERPEWLRELGGFEEEAPAIAQPAAAAAAPPVRSRPERAGGSGLLSNMVGSGPRGMAFGMTAQQRMILSIFLFLDISVLACMLLFAIGAINIGLP